MKSTVRLALAGISGYGSSYLRHLLPDAQAHDVQLVGVIDPYADRSDFLEEIQQRQIPVYDNLEAFFADNHADLMALATPIHLHADQTIQCLERGVSVLCEKPLCVTIQDARRMAEAEAQHPGFVAIGYQWSFSKAIQNLKRDIIAGDFGKPILLKSRIYWPRTPLYYQRNNWAARIQSDDGTWILDSPANNATAHYIHNMFYILGDTRETSTPVNRVQAELYRANDIENYDTIAMRAFTQDEVEILFYASHATQNNINPIFDYHFENATVTFATDGSSEIEAHFKDGSHRNYGNPFENGMDKIWQCADGVRTGDKPACGIAASTSQTLCINGAQESPDSIVDFPAESVHIDKTGLNYVEGLEEHLTTCYEDNRLPSEMENIPWAKAAHMLDLAGYEHFPRNAPAR